MEYFAKNPCIPPLPRSKSTDAVLLALLSDIDASHTWLQQLKKQVDPGRFYNYRKTRIQSTAQIPKPVKMTEDGIPASILNHIDERTLWSIDFTFHLQQDPRMNRQIKIHFVDDKDGGNKYFKYVDRMLTWIHLIDKYAAKHCSRQLTIFVYLTPLFKKLPSHTHHVLGETHVNTAYTTSCNLVNEIIVFRREEWMKVFMHETFHSFGLDFSAMDTHACHARILQTFPVESDVNLFEAYTEFWAETMNVLFCCYFGNTPPDTNPERPVLQDLLSNVYFCLNIERQFTVFQMAKALDFMGLTYPDLFSKNKAIAVLRQERYREKTNVLAYYVLTTILLANFHAFLSWCHVHNGSSKILQFKPTQSAQHAFCAFIESHYKTKALLEGEACSFTRLQRLKGPLFLKNTLRMTVFEMDA